MSRSSRPWPSLWAPPGSWPREISRPGQWCTCCRASHRIARKSGTEILLNARLISSSILSDPLDHPVTGHLHSLFRRAANLLFDGRLITFTLPEIGPLPNGVVLRESIDLLSLGLAPGMRVTGDRQALIVADAGAVIRMEDALAWSPRLEVRADSRSRERLRRNLRLALPKAAAYAPEAGFGPILPLLGPMGLRPLLWECSRLCQTAYPTIERILGALRAGDHLLAARLAESLIGLGDGLTPSGDDFLVGVGAALRVVDHVIGSDFSRACAEVSRGRTTLVAETLLLHAGRGEYGERLHGLLGALLAGAPAIVDSALRSTIAWGHTSGADTVLGVLLGLVSVFPPAEMRPSRRR